MAKSIISGMERHFKDYKPDTEPKEITSVPGKLQKHKENTSRSRYVWLPIDWEGDKPVVRWQRDVGDVHQLATGFRRRRAESPHALFMCATRYKGI